MRDDNQLPLFSARTAVATPSAPPTARPMMVVTTMGDDEVIAAIPAAGMADTIALAAEAGRRQLATAVPSLAAVCRRLTGFVGDAPVPEQVATLEALTAIGGSAAAQAVATAIIRRQVQGPTLATAVWAAAKLSASLPGDTVVELLRHDNPAVRADACRCARAAPDVIGVMVDLLHDLTATVHSAAACALGRMGRVEALPVLLHLLECAPTIEVVEAAAGVADDSVFVILGQVARSRPHLSAAVLAALDGSDMPMAAKVADGLRLGVR